MVRHKAEWYPVRLCRERRRYILRGYDTALAVEDSQRHPWQYCFLPSQLRCRFERLLPRYNILRRGQDLRTEEPRWTSTHANGFRDSFYLARPARSSKHRYR